MSAAEELKIDVSPYVNAEMAKTKVFALVDSLLENGTADIKALPSNVLIAIPIFPNSEIEIYIPIKTMQELCKNNDVKYKSLFK